MNHRTTAFSVTAGLLLIACLAGNVHAQGMAAANAAFDRQFNARLQSMQQQNTNAQQQLWQNFMRDNGPRLRQQYAQMVASGNRSMSFEQFAYWDLMTARGSNVQGALQHQRNQFAGQQAAHATVMQGNASYNAGWAQNSQRQSAAVARYSEQAIRGVGNYVDPATGAQTKLPYSLAPGQTYQSNGSVYAQDNQGTYWRNDGNGWSRLQAGR
ncbi:MAG: hypothetical protein M3Z16_08255 [Pseudomonadota bacterium]|nr:hypothetical protein [Pseudomonadota bacterium]